MKRPYLLTAKNTPDVNNSLFLHGVKEILEAILCMLDDNLASAKMS